MASDRYLLIAKIKLKLARNFKQNKSKRTRYDIEKLKQKKIKESSILELKNRFSALENSLENINYTKRVYKAEMYIGINTEIFLIQLPRKHWE